MKAFATVAEPVLLVAMVAVFVATAVSVYWPGRRRTVERPGLIPFKDDA